VNLYLLLSLDAFGVLDAREMISNIRSLHSFRVTLRGSPTPLDRRYSWTVSPVERLGSEGLTVDSFKIAASGFSLLVLLLICEAVEGLCFVDLLSDTSTVAVSSFDGFGLLLAGGAVGELASAETSDSFTFAGSTLLTSVFSSIGDTVGGLRFEDLMSDAFTVAGPTFVVFVLSLVGDQVGKLGSKAPISNLKVGSSVVALKVTLAAG